MRLFLIFILFISSFYSAAQTVTETIIGDIRHALQSRQINVLNDYIEAEQHHNFIRWETLREIVDNRQEGVLKIEIAREPDSIGNIDNFSITLLADKERIFFYELTKWIFKKKNAEDYESYPIIVDSYKDLASYQLLKDLFTVTYHSPIDTTDLFQTSIVYGSSCGIAGTPTEYYKKLDSLIQYKDLLTLSSWLRSPNIEKQLYAIEGFKTMERFGYRLTAEDYKIIELISQKKGLVKVCSGCIYSADSIKNIIAQIDSSIFPSKNQNNNFRLYFGLAIILLILLLLLFYKKYKRNKDSVQQ